MSTQVTELRPDQVARVGAVPAQRRPPPVRRPGAARRLWARLRPHEREALGWWVLSRVSVLIVAAQAAYVFATKPYSAKGPADSWYVWDTQHYIKIAIYGYDGPPRNTIPLEAFFPGYPAILKLVHYAVPSWVLAGMLISFVAGGVAVLALTRIVSEEFGEAAGGRAALLFCVSPLAVFMVAGYTEALFLGLALPAWLYARRGRWAYAAVLAAGASCVRITGLFLAVALIVHFAAQWLPQRPGVGARPEARALRAAPWLAVPFLPVLGYFAYLHHRTGNWLYWFEAQKRGWHRERTGFSEAFWTTYDKAYENEGISANWRWEFRLEILAVLLGALLVIVLLARRRYAEAAYVGISLYALATSTEYFSVTRAALLWWPLWVGLGVAAAHPRYGRWFTRGYVALCVPLAGVFVAAFVTDRWVG